MNSNQFQPPAVKESAQSAIKDVAFTHVYRPPIIAKKESTTLVNFVQDCLSKDESTSLVNFVRDSDQSIDVYIINGVPMLRLNRHDDELQAKINLATHSAELESIARNLIDAAHYLRQQASQKVPA